MYYLLSFGAPEMSDTLDNDMKGHYGGFDTWLSGGNTIVVVASVL